MLDAGCGTGRLLVPTVNGGASAVGLDRDRAMLEMASRRTHAPLLQADAAVFPLRPASLDAVVAVALLEFVTARRP